MISRPDLLVVGAGPAGLSLALQAHDHGARVRIVERRPDAFRPSRALIVHARTLEVLRPLGVVEALLAKADIAPSVRLHLGSRVVAVDLDGLVLPDTAFAHLTLLRQLDVEAVLSRALADRGVEVERGVELVRLRVDTVDGPRATLRSAAGVEEVISGAVAGCDGVASTVRTHSGIGWRGRPYRQEVLLADVELDSDLAPGIAHVVAARGGLLFLFALGERAPWRLMATRHAGPEPLPLGQPGPPVPAEQLQQLVDDSALRARITDQPWSTVVRLQHGIADRYRDGPVFLAGDAAHVNSPAGGQGMNTGIQDAANLGWKVAFARHSSQPDDLLDSYEQERRPVARLVRTLTDLVFWAESGTDLLAAFTRTGLAALGAPVLPLILRRPALISQAVRVLSQLWVSYHSSPLSVGTTTSPRGQLRPGDRFPDGTVTAGGRQLRVHQLLARPGVHIMLHADAREPAAALSRPYVHVHRLTSIPGRGIVAVRPDGYVGLLGEDDQQLGTWLSLVGPGPVRTTAHPAGAGEHGPDSTR
jgi:2-polyprenyl-6-methoxyphenol hydroxylase-like FAD-dependent oxidoreductase